jgi:hypothetical protein
VKDALHGVEETDGNVDIGDVEDGEERGRLFVKVVGLKDLDLPLPQGKTSWPFLIPRLMAFTLGERSYFALTLDNGLHCVTTAWLELGKFAPIGQEFELVVLNDLEFQLTLQVKVEEPKTRAQQSVVSSPTKAAKAQKPSTFSRVFASPKKRKELELRQQLEAQQLRQQKADAKALAAGPSSWDTFRGLVAQDGSFARAYVSLADFEKNCFGRPYTVDVTCFNEWAVDETVSSVKSKRGSEFPSGAGSQRRPPYRIGNLELQFLYVPKPKGVKDEDLPKSMNACIREMREAENTAARTWEGFLSQQGGDCPVCQTSLHPPNFG